MQLLELLEKVPSWKDFKVLNKISGNDDHFFNNLDDDANASKCWMKMMSNPSI
jgi:hypothetical protein